MNPENEPHHPCFWESDEPDECLQPNAPGSFWCARHTKIAFTVGDTALDTWDNPAPPLGTGHQAPGTAASLPSLPALERARG